MAVKPKPKPKGEIFAAASKKPRNVNHSALQHEALELRRKGAPYHVIASRIGVSKSTAWDLVDGALKTLATEIAESAEQVRAIELMRLDAVLIPMLAAAEGGNHSAVDRVLRIIDLRAKLLGLYAPTQVEQTGVTWVVTLGGAPVIDVTQPQPSALLVDDGDDHDRPT